MEADLTTRNGRRRRDALANHERIVTAAIARFAADGFRAPVADIADAAGVGIGTFYRCFEDRTALLEELGRRAYRHLEDLLAEIDADGLVGLTAVRRFLHGSLEIGDRLVLPLHGAPAVVTEEATRARVRIADRIAVYLEQARTAGVLTSDANPTDVFLCAAMISRPPRSGPSWDRARRRHVEVFIAGLGRFTAPGEEPVSQSDIEADFAHPDRQDVALRATTPDR